MTYRRLPEGEVSDTSQGRTKVDKTGITASEVNEFRRKVYLNIWLLLKQEANTPGVVLQQIPNQGDRRLAEKRQSTSKNS